MKQLLLNISEDTASYQSLDAALSFKPFCDFLNTKLSSEETVKSDLYSFLIKKFNQYPELKNSVDVNVISKYNELLELIYTSMSGITSEEILWALATPDASSLFYGTDSMFDLIKNIKSEKEKKENKNLRLSFVYSTILEKLYQYNSLIKGEIIQPFADAGEGILKYYKMSMDATFIEVLAKGELPKLDFREIETHINKDTLLEYLSKILPLNLFSFRGFSIIRLYDRTEEFAIKKIKDSIANSSTQPKEATELIEALKALAGDKQLNFSLIPFIKLNNKFLLDFTETLIPNAMLLSMIEDFFQKPKPIFFKNISDNNDSSNPLISELQKSKIVSYALLPLLHNNRLTGALEIYTDQKNLLNEKVLLRTDTALPHLAHFMKNAIDDFNSRMVNIVYQKFTSIQSPVQWKFNEAAWHYMQAKQTKKGKIEMETIGFKNVYPLYGSIDVRNFSIERNNALLEDLRQHLNLLIETFTTVKQNKSNSKIDEMISKCNSWLNQLNDTFDDNNKQKLNKFIEKEIQPFLTQLKLSDNISSVTIDNYLNELDEKKGKINESRRNLETSLEMITDATGNYLELMNEECQQLYPCYFEKFRSDGIEYDIYIGESIAPDKPFTPEHLKNLRLLQLKSMAAIYKITNGLLALMPKELHITQLIFINGEPIDIYFRNDEKRFDVEGTFNVRYQMIKKRIDKVHILNTEERLTQVGKIALVYLNKKDADEYVSYIHSLQEQNILNNDLEYLELEELQGVQGLKALRVGVTINVEVLIME